MPTAYTPVELRSPGRGIDMYHFPTTGPRSTAKPHRIRFSVDIPNLTDQDVMASVYAWLDNRDIHYKTHKTTWEVVYFDIYLSDNEFFDFKLRWL